MLSNKKIECPNNLLDLAKTPEPLEAAIICAGNALSIESAMEASNRSFIRPILIGDREKIEYHTKQLNWNIESFEIIDEKRDDYAASIGAKLASEEKVKILIKGHIHTDILMKAMLKKDLNLIGSRRLSHLWHMTIDSEDKPIFITDGALNVSPRLEVKMHILKNAVDFAKKTGIIKPKVAVLSGTEDPIESIPSSIEAEEITKRAKEENIQAIVYGPLAFDNAVSKNAAKIKNINNKVAGEADIILVPNLETGNSLVKMMIYFMGACAAGIVVGGKVPIVVTSRADDKMSRLASIAAAVIAAKN
ncbi:MAG: Phosphate acetyltransferase [Alphaproteobacteria bacterium MarineAlpha5_Bin11]|nr:phosphate acetyltransferase [Pelagibacteraceae bacterium]PPR43911.1 MAG: Phosphate acetyltransferase [Alphaproteobacteria bacterium MarineAlpha5_Bin11]PPR51969.1 MAG: Phosphate acetyltransferase [Alphaproteobacteria bacterium MarineAlpha5_Bin10]|tara:strand:- start:16488 stop:17402 length:915 start_codon:yes stop_codon:yes gene_type:complete